MVVWNRGRTCKATYYSQTSWICVRGTLYGFSVLGHHDLATVGTMAGSSVTKGAGRVGRTDREGREGLCKGTYNLQKSTKMHFSQTIQTLPFFPSKLLSANVSAMTMREAHHDSPFNES